MPTDPIFDATAVEVEKESGWTSPNAYKLKPIDYIDPAPKPFKVQISLVEYFERVKRLKADKWQHHFCNYLQTAIEKRHTERTWAEFHAQAQLGKTVILSQIFPAWCFGHDPLFRYVLAMYNTTRSETHSDVVIQIMRSQLHQEIFPDKAGHLPASVSKEGWRTNGRRELNDGQTSMNPVGLQSGITGSGFDWLTIDDPYKEPKDAFSETVRNNLARFWEYGVDPRLNKYSCIAAMFHRYSPDDFGGYLLDTGKFDYVRYAAIADGPYIHDETGQRFEDPLGREEGELISERFDQSYYEGKQENKQVFLSMFQGRPSSEEGEFFNIGKIEVLKDPEAIAKRKAECSVFVRAWDLAATEEGGDYSVAPLTGMSPDKRSTWFDVVRKQVESAGRDQLMLETAQKDGFDVVVSVPVDPAAAGKTAFYHIQQLLKGYQVVGRSTSGSKTDRARPWASSCNSGMVSFADDSHLEPDKQWVKAAKRELRDFPLGVDHDDFVDSGADGYNECFERISQGLVVKDLTLQHLVTFEAFKAKFPFLVENVNTFKIPAKWTVYAGIKITPDASMANSGVVVARPSENANLGEMLFVVAEYKEYTADFFRLFDWLDETLQMYCEKPRTAVLWLHKDSASYEATIRQKLKYGLRVFKEDALSGLTELGWYLGETDKEHPFSGTGNGKRLYGLLGDPQQLTVPVDDGGLLALRQESATWRFNDKNVPNATGAVLECLRMICYQFHTYSHPKTVEEKVKELIPPEVITAVQTAKTSTERLTTAMDYEFQRDIARQKIEPEFELEEWE